MQFLSLAPFIPSGKDFERSKQLFIQLGFNLTWEGGGYAGFENGNCQFILQDYDDSRFAENLMIIVKVPDIQAFRADIIKINLVEQFGIRIGEVTHQPYGKEVNVIDIAGVCWHFVE